MIIFGKYFESELLTKEQVIDICMREKKISYSEALSEMATWLCDDLIRNEQLKEISANELFCIISKKLLEMIQSDRK